MTPFSVEPNVELLIEGIIALNFETNAQGEVVACLAGAVANVPDHVLKVTGRKIDQNGNVQDFTFDPNEPQFFLEAAGTSQRGITFANKNAPIDRIAGTGAPDSIAWVLDFAGRELFDRMINLDQTGFRSVVRVTTGEMFTSIISINHLLTRSAVEPDAPLTLVGKVATEVGLAIRLDTPESIARFTTGGGQTVIVEPGQRLILRFKQVCANDDIASGGQLSAHANHYYNALAVDVADRKSFSSTRFVQTTLRPTASPEASCLVVRNGP